MIHFSNWFFPFSLFYFPSFFPYWFLVSVYTNVVYSVYDYSFAINLDRDDDIVDWDRYITIVEYESIFEKFL